MNLPNSLDKNISKNISKSITIPTWVIVSLLLGGSGGAVLTGFSSPDNESLKLINYRLDQIDAQLEKVNSAISSLDEKLSQHITDSYKK